MRPQPLAALPLALLAFTATLPALAQEITARGPIAPRTDATTPATVLPRRLFMGLSGGVAYVTARHPQLIPSSFSAATLGLHVGYDITEKWALGVELTTAEKYVTRDDPFKPFIPAGLSPQAGCNQCETPPPGGWLGKITALFGTLGPRVEFTPFGRDGLYLSGSAGLGFIYGIDNRIGASGTARAGYRFRLADTIGLALEGGFQGQIYEDAHALMPYVVAMFRPYF